MIWQVLVVLLVASAVLGQTGTGKQDARKRLGGHHGAGGFGGGGGFGPGGGGFGPGGGGFGQGGGGFGHGGGGFGQGGGGFGHGSGGFGHGGGGPNDFGDAAEGVFGPGGGIGPGGIGGHGGEVSSGCRYWCRTPEGQAFCCETDEQPLSPPISKPDHLGQCPPVRPVCPATKFGPPKTCSSDGSCPGVEKCCYDRCLGTTVCKTPFYKTPVHI